MAAFSGTLHMSSIIWIASQSLVVFWFTKFGLEPSFSITLDLYFIIYPFVILT